MDKASYRCDKGFDLIGPSGVTCLENRKWNDEAPVCKESILTFGMFSIILHHKSVQFIYHSGLHFKSFIIQIQA